MIALHLLSLAELRALASDASDDTRPRSAPGGLPPPFVIDATIAALAAGQDPQWRSFFVVIDDDTIVAAAGFKGPPRDGRVEIGYNVAEPLRGRGLATAAAQELLRIAFRTSGVEAVIAKIAATNGASRRVVEKCGFRRTGESVTDDRGTLELWIAKRGSTQGSSA